MGNYVHDIYQVLHLIVLSVGAFLVLLIEVFRKPTPEPSLTLAGGATVAPTPIGMRETTVVLALAGSVVALLGGASSNFGPVFGGILFNNPFSVGVTLLLIFGTLAALLLGMRTLSLEGVSARGEYYSLFLMALVGAIIFVSAGELITLFLGLEIMSMALYCLCGSATSGSGRTARRSTEAAMKYFLLGSFSSAFLLYGIALVYGLTGSTFVSDIAITAGGVNVTMLLFSIGLMLVGLTFKIGAVPFHFWVPDVYDGAPTSLTAFMATVIKAAAVAAAGRLLIVAFGVQAPLWTPAIWVLAVLTMSLGNLVALRQRSVKRMLAYSSIAHAGYLLVGFLALANNGIAAVLYYLVAYSLLTMGAFGVLLAVCVRNYQSEDSARLADDIINFNGLASRRPVLAAVMSLFMLGLAGIPPGLSGLVGKFYLFGSAMNAGYVGIVIIAVLNSAVSCYFYLRVIVAMYFIEEDKDAVHADVPVDVALGSVLAFCAVFTIVLGIFPPSLPGITILTEDAPAITAGQQ